VHHIDRPGKRGDLNRTCLAEDAERTLAVLSGLGRRIRNHGHHVTSCRERRAQYLAEAFYTPDGRRKYATYEEYSQGATPK
jgi:hypothetical protein